MVPTRPESSRKPQPLAAELILPKAEALEGNGRGRLGGRVEGQLWTRREREIALEARLFQSTDVQRNSQREAEARPPWGKTHSRCSIHAEGCPRAEGRWGHRATYLPQGCCAEESAAGFPRLVPGLTCHLLRNRTRSHRWFAASPRAPVPWAPATCQGGAARGGSR